MYEFDGYIQMTIKDRVALIRSKLRAMPGLGKISVRMGRGTACAWVDVAGSEEWGKFTDEERAGLEIAGWARNYTSGNGFNISPDEVSYFAERYNNGNRGFRLEGDYRQSIGWHRLDSSDLYYALTYSAGLSKQDAIAVIEQAKTGVVVKVNKAKAHSEYDYFLVQYVDYNNGAPVEPKREEIRTWGAPEQVKIEERVEEEPVKSNIIQFEIQEERTMDETKQAETLTKEQLSRLPLWAQNAYNSLMIEARNLRHENDTLRAALGESPLEGASGLVTWSVLMDDYMLPDSAGVRFSMNQKGEAGSGLYVEAGFRKSDLNEGKRILYLRSSSQQLIIRPLASNVVTVTLEEFGRDD